ncbi:MAG: 3-isopropylmalate dehydratase large subunit [Clostridia bacterium]|nr:3-isopropylmalate dehydratase large subunit [Clostridia bacterium]
MTMTEKILAKSAGLDRVVPGQMILSQVDLVLGNDITAPVAIQAFFKMGRESVFDPDKIALVMDHFTPNKDIKAAQQCACCRTFAKEAGLTHFYDTGRAGIEHALLPEQGLVTCGDVIVGADSHTCTYGALGAFSTGVGSTDMACAMATGKAWFKVPSTIRVNLTGRLPEFVSGKDAILTLIGMLGVDGALYQSLEFGGTGLSSLSVSDRLCMANMAIEAGAKNGIFEVDELTLEYLKNAGSEHPSVFAPDRDACYSKIVTLNLSKLIPVAAFPHLPDRIHPATVKDNIVIDQVVIGSCTNGRIEDLRQAAAILKGKKIADGLRLIVIPATQKVYLQAMEEGLLKQFIEAGGIVSTPTCGPCLGGHTGVLAEGERAVATTNRNFVGRMGHPGSEVYLASPAVAAASALMGKLASPLEVM